MSPTVEARATSKTLLRVRRPWRCVQRYPNTAAGRRCALPAGHTGDHEALISVGRDFVKTIDWKTHRPPSMGDPRRMVRGKGNAFVHPTYFDHGALGECRTERPKVSCACGAFRIEWEPK